MKVDDPRMCVFSYALISRFLLLSLDLDSTTLTDELNLVIVKMYMCTKNKRSMPVISKVRADTGETHRQRRQNAIQQLHPRCLKCVIRKKRHETEKRELSEKPTVALGGIWVAALSIVSIQSIQTPLDRFSNAKSNTLPRSGNVLAYVHNTHKWHTPLLGSDGLRPRWQTRYAISLQFKN